MKNNPFAVAQKYLDKPTRIVPAENKIVLTDDDPIPQDNLISIRAWIVSEARGENGELRAVLICSAVLEAHLWVVWDRGFELTDNLAAYYAEELPLLSGKSLGDLKLIQETKLIFPGCRVVQ